MANCIFSIQCSLQGECNIPVFLGAYWIRNQDTKMKYFHQKLSANLWCTKLVRSANISKDFCFTHLRKNIYIEKRLKAVLCLTIVHKIPKWKINTLRLLLCRMQMCFLPPGVLFFFFSFWNSLCLLNQTKQRFLLRNQTFFLM